MGGVRCWVGTDRGIEGFSPDGGEPRLIVAEPVAKVAAVGDRLAVVHDRTFSLHDGSTGEVRSQRDAPKARGVLTGGGQLWLDEARTARGLDPDGHERAVVELGDGIGLLAVDDDHLVTMVPGAFDYGVVRVLSLAGETVLETARLTNVDRAALTGDAVVVASAEGVQRFPLDGGPDDARPGDGRPRVVAAPPGWIEVWDDRHDATVGSRLVRVAADGAAVERRFPTPVVDVTSVAGRTWVIVPQRPAAPLQPVGPVSAVELGDDLEAVSTFALGDPDWRGGFAVCVAT
jgi:hypothetical protein